MKKIVFFDIDGTLIDDATQTLPESALEAVAALRQQGHLGRCRGSDHLLHRGNNRLGRGSLEPISTKNLGESAGSSVYALSCGERKYLYKYNHWICGGRRLNRYSC